jgi:flagellar biosynthesis protein FliP
VVPRLRACLPLGGQGTGAALTRALGALLLALVAVVLLATPSAADPITPIAPIAPIAPVAPVATVAPAAPASPGATRPSGAPADPAPGGVPDLREVGDGGTTDPVTLVLLLGSLSLLPGLLIMVTAFTRIVIVLGFVRSALGTQGVPPNQVLIGLALFLTFFVMGPALSEANDTALQPYLAGTISQGEAFERGLEPFRAFMLEQVREEDLQLFVDLARDPQPATPDDVATTTLIPAFVIGELRAAFLIGFVIFVPFIVLDLVISAALSAMGMAMLPPSLVSLPFKLLLFVAVDGWYLITSSLVRSFG